jgi:hypothetical protein
MRLRCRLLAPGSTIGSGPIAESWTPIKTRSPNYDGLRKAKAKIARIRAQHPHVVLAA